MTRTRVAAFTPGPPLHTGGAAYAGALLPALAEHVDLVAVSPVPIAWDGPTLTPDEVRPDQYDVLVHFLGDNPDHLFAYRSALRWGGVVVCHELLLPHVLSAFAPEEEALDLAEQFGDERALALRGRRARQLATHQEVYLLQVVCRPLRSAEAAVVHSRFLKFVLEAELPDLPVHHVPSHTGAVPPGLDLDGDALLALRTRLGIPARAFVVGLFGYLGGHKRVIPSLQALALAAPIAREKGVRLCALVVGGEVARGVQDAIDDLGIADLSIVRGTVDDRSFFEHMAAIDVLVGLRYPTLGETSATMLQAMRLGKPVVTSDHAQFAEERAAVRIAADSGEVEGVAAALVTLATCRPRYERIADLSRARAATATLAATTSGYLGVIESVVRGSRARRFGSVE